ncbi:hypothetical protein B0T20DRAFT_55059 [Sordaria brevicollis]|uniref:Uncharacterized protein n=1 Tax=Sordaria brevicollis TaxID=83679 RepID=A0AAE0U632_SORBR|nr:hypothetical protein B0T20DRAFT_55059 [Sordaria brevicollis]
MMRDRDITAFRFSFFFSRLSWDWGLGKRLGWLGKLLFLSLHLDFCIFPPCYGMYHHTHTGWASPRGEHGPSSPAHSAFPFHVTSHHHHHITTVHQTGIIMEDTHSGASVSLGTSSHGQCSPWLDPGSIEDTPPRVFGFFTKKYNNPLPTLHHIREIMYTKMQQIWRMDIK